MNLVKSPLKIGESSQEVANVQTALASLGFAIPADEMNRQTAGPGTTQAVRDFQSQNKIQADDSLLVDGATAAFINRLLKDRNLLTDASYTITGKVLNSRREALAGKSIQAFDLDLRGAKIYKTAQTLDEITANKGMLPLGSAVSLADGSYSISFGNQQLNPAEPGLPDVIVYAITENKIIGRSALSTDSNFTNGNLLQGWDVAVAGTADRGVSEFTTLLQQVQERLRISSVAMNELYDSPDQTDFLASEIEQPLNNVQLLITAYRLAQTFPNDPQTHSLLYGLGRGTIPLSFSAIAVTSDDKLLAAWHQAFDANIIDTLDDRALEAFLIQLHQTAAQQLLAAPPIPEAATLSKTLSITTADKNLQASFIDASRSFTGTAEDFWNKYLPSLPGFSPSFIESLQLTNQLVSLTGNHLPLVEVLQQERKIQHPSDLLGFADTDWTDVLKKSGVPAATPGDTDAEKTTNYKEQLQMLLNAAFPTKKIALMLSEGQLPIQDATVKQGLQSFFPAAPNFDISASRVVDYQKELVAAGGQNAPLLQQNLARIQRLFALSPTPDALAHLMAAGFHSAVQIANIPQQAFVDMNAVEFGGTDIALAIHQRASFQTMRMEKLVGGLRDVAKSIVPAVIQSVSGAQAAQDVIQKNVPNWTALFGSPDSCECEECRSVYGAAAYMVDILQFLGHIQPNFQNKTPLDTLFLRRADIAFLPLTCENTNTIIPYIDIVNEIMEYYVANGPLDAKAAYDTGDATAEELRCNPQNTLREAYSKLKDAIYPFSLPYSQPLDVERIYYGQLNTTRTEIMTVLQKDLSTSANTAIHAESLSLSQEGYVVLTGKDFNGNDRSIPTREYYGNGYSDDNDFLSRIYKVPEFLRSTGLLYTDVINLLETQFVNPGQPLLDYIEDLFSASTLASADIYQKLKNIAGGADPSADTNVMAVLNARSIPSADFKTWAQTNFPIFQHIITSYQTTSDCDLATTQLRTLQSIYENQPTSGISLTDTFSKLHRFIRIWNKLQWSMSDLDILIADLGESDITPGLIDKLSIVKQILDTVMIPPDKLATLWGNIQVYGKNTLYQRLFLSRTIQEIDKAFQPDRSGAYLTDKTQFLKDHLEALQAAFRVSGEDLTAILADAALPPDTSVLNLVNISILYRYVVLSKAVSASIPDMISIKSLFQLDPFSRYDTVGNKYTDILPQNTWQFLLLVNHIQSSGLRAPALNYMIGGVANPALGLDMPDETLQNILMSIRKGFLQIENDHPDPDGQTNITEDLLKSKMQLIYQPAVVDTLISILNGNAIFNTLADKNIPVTIPAPQSNYVTYVNGSGRLQCTGVLSDQDKTLLSTLTGATPGFQVAVQDLYSQPEQFLKDNFSPLFTIPFANVLANLLNHPTQTIPPAEQDKLNWFYSYFLPYLKNQLRHNILVQTIASAIGLDEPTTEALVQPQADALVQSVAQTGLTGTYFTDETFTTAGLTRNDKQIDFSWGTQAPATGIPASAFSIRWEGLVNPPTSADYTLVVQVADAGTGFKLFVNDQLLLQKNTGDALLAWEEVISLSMGKTYTIKLEFIDQSGSAGIQLYWKTATTPKQIIDTTDLYPSAVFTDLSGWMKKYHRAAIFITNFQLKAPEIIHLMKFSVNFGGIDLTQISKDHWQRIYDYTSLRQSMPGPSTGLIELFELANQNNPAPALNDVLNKIAALTGWNPDTLSWLVIQQFTYNVADFTNEIAMLVLLKAIRLVQKTGVAANILAAWAAQETDFNNLYDQSQKIKKVVKARYEDSDWPDIAKKLSNQLREDQKQALIAYLLVQPELIQWGVIDADSLYEYFLIDVQMCSCMDTSRIVQSTAAIQLFITRCILNKESRPDGSGHETGVGPNQIDQSSATRWEWMQYYRVWEANRKVFLYPENWLDPELRDDKSPFFAELESELMQNDITDDSVQTAFYNYLNKLDEVSHLDTCGVFQENDDNSQLKTLHVFGRTHGKPHLLFYRTCDRYWHWSAWEKVSVDVKGVDGVASSSSPASPDNPPMASGVHSTPLLWKNRLFIFWPEFLKKQPDTTSNDNSTFQDASKKNISTLKADPYWEVTLGWSEYKNGKWTPKSISNTFFNPTTLHQSQDAGFGDSVFYTSVLCEFEPDLKNYFISPFIDSAEQLYLSLVHNRMYTHGQFILNDIHNPVQTAFVASPDFFEKPSDPANYQSNFMQLANPDGAEPVTLKLRGNTYLRSTPEHKLIYSPQFTDFEKTLNYPFFYRDDSRAYFIRTTDISYRRTIQHLRQPAKNKFLSLQAMEYAEAPNYIPHPIGNPAAVSTLQANTARTAGNGFPSAAVVRKAENASIGISTQTGVIDAKYDSIAGAFAGSQPLPSYMIPIIFNKGLTFYTNYHPYSQAFIRALNTKDIQGLMACNTLLPDDGGILFEKAYSPDHSNGLVQAPSDLSKFTYYKENVAFDEFSLYGIYNWELFYHAPLYIATRLSRNGKYQDAMKWFHYIFDPTTNDLSPDPNFPESRYWKLLPFKTTLPQSLLDYFESLQPGVKDPHIEEWKDNPFKPFLVARDRPIAFMKNVVMKYLDNLIAWGDDLFRTDTRENINTATQLYIIASHILGPKPQMIPSRGQVKSETYNSLRAKLDDFSNAIVDLENLFPYTSDITVTDNPFPGSLLGVGSTLYFCIPDNDRLLQYWDIVGDRLFKIRHCMNIDGVERSLALFAPPIDPGMLIRATAAGLSIGSILADLNSPAPIYRFNYLVQKATEFCAEVKALGSALLTAIEKKENEELSRIRAAHETIILNKMTAVKERQILEATANQESLGKSRDMIVNRINYYVDYLGISGFTVPAPPAALPDTIDQDSTLPDTSITEVDLKLDTVLADSGSPGVKIIQQEQEQLNQSESALNSQLDSLNYEILSGFMALIPDFNTHATPLGVGLALTFGGHALSWMASSEAKQKTGDSASASHSAAKASIMAGYIRRDQDSVHQLNLALRELAQLDKQLVASDIRVQLAKKELEIHQQQIDNAQEIEDYLQNALQGHSKFTTQEFYQWMKEQLFAVYKQSYQMAFDMARRAEKAYQFELGVTDTTFIQYGYFDSNYQGLTAGEQLHSAIKQLEKSFIEQNKREFELTKHLSLALLRPDLLLQLKQTGSCEWSWPEELFDLDYPGHYFRRIKSVSISIPCVSGPYTTINATLRLLGSSVRIKTTRGDNGYMHNNDNGVLTDDDRFMNSNTPFVAIATSSAQNDSGVFELNFRDERYLPFEGAGAISKWRLELNGKYLKEDSSVIDISQYDFNSVSDIIAHVRFTSREDAGQFRLDALGHLQDYFANAMANATAPLMRLFSARNDLPTQWYHFLHPVNTTDDQVLALDLSPIRFPFFVQLKKINITGINLVADSTLMGINGLQLVFPDATSETLNLGQDGKYGNWLHGSKDYSQNTKSPGAWSIRYPGSNNPLTEYQLKNLVIVVYYEIS